MKNKLTTEERDILISSLALVTGWNPSAYENMPDQELQEEYDKRVLGL